MSALTAAVRCCCHGPPAGRVAWLAARPRRPAKPTTTAAAAARRRRGGGTRAASSTAASAGGRAGSAPAYHDARIEDIRNVGIIAHVDAGKTTTTERMLYYSGATRHLGNVDHGDTTTDFLPMERARGITIQSAAISFHWPPVPPGGGLGAPPPKTINLIDTPGHQDFRFEVDRCLPVLDGAVCILDAVKGVEAHTERVWASAQQHGIPRLVFVNKLDRDGASFRRAVLDVAARLRAWPLVCHLPLWDARGEVFQGVVDVIERRGLRWPPGGGGGGCTLVPAETLRASRPALWAEMETARARLIERLCEDDDALVEAFADQGPEALPASLVKAAVRRVVRRANGRVVPVLAGSSLRNMGIEPLLDAIVDYLPSPLEAPDVAVRIGDEPGLLSDVVPTMGSSSGSSGGALASVFKVVHDPSLFPGTHGMVAFVRVYDGALHKNAPLWNANLGRFEKPFQIAQVSAAQMGEIPRLGPGQIGAVTGLKAARTGDTLHLLPPAGPKAGPKASPGGGLSLAQRRLLTIRPPDVGPAVAFVTAEAYGTAETKKLADALDKLAREDPSLRWSRGGGGGDATTAAAAEDTFVLSGLGQLHLDVAMDRLRTTYGVRAAFGDVQVDYKECLTAPATAAPVRSVYDRVVANKAGRAACTVSVEPVGGPEASATTATTTTTTSTTTTTTTTTTFSRDGNVVCVRITAPADGAPGLDVDMVSRQLCSGVYGALARGPRRGSPLHGCRVTVDLDAAAGDYGGPGTDGHVVHAALHAVRAALRTAHAAGRVAVLEPVMLVRIACPDDSAGAVQRDIAGARGGVVLEVAVAGGPGSSSSSSDGPGDGDDGPHATPVYAPPDPYDATQSLRAGQQGATRLLEIVAKVPLQEMLAYDSRLRSMTAGRHAFTMQLDSFERVVGARERLV